MLAAVERADGINSTTFNEAQHEIYLLMETNFFQRFYRDLLKRTGTCRIVKNLRERCCITFFVERMLRNLVPPVWASRV